MVRWNNEYDEKVREGGQEGEKQGLTTEGKRSSLAHTHITTSNKGSSQQSQNLQQKQRRVRANKQTHETVEGEG